MKDILLNRINRVAQLANSGKWTRFFNAPTKYVYAIGYRAFVYPRKRKAVKVSTSVFWGEQMTIALPSATDIYLTGGKTHDSEIRLVKFLIHTLESKSVVLDIGAHYGYFSLLSAKICHLGQVFAFEPTSFSYGVLAENARKIDNLNALNMAISDSGASIDFYEFDNQYSEYNTSDITQFEHEPWFQEHRPKKVTIQGNSISHFCTEHNLRPQLIKIDVEGLEDIVISGAITWLSQHAEHRPIFVLEYLSEERTNTPHKNAVSQLKQFGYQSYIINKDGWLDACEDIDSYLKQHAIDSENVVLK